jgi:DNA uptake protein ComE-like DNA-binding protein
VAYRQQHGPFTRVEQLHEAKLVNASTFEKIKDLIEL